MNIGIISDTHGHLPADVFKVFKDVNHILHAGDIGDPNIIIQLESIAPVSAVYGNIDTWPIVTNYPRMEILNLADCSICLVHDIVSFKYFRFELFKMNLIPDIVVYGHTHIPGYEYYQKILFLNPGSASRPKGSKKGSVCLIKMNKGSISEPEFHNISWR
jgi:putative phosphoesterase